MKTIHIEKIEDIEKELFDFKILFAYNSNKIENNEITFHDTRDIFEHGIVHGFTGDLKTLYQIENQKNTFDYLKDKIIQKEPLSKEFILTIHKKLTRRTYDETRYHLKNERPGSFKKHDYVTGVHEVGSTPDQVEKDISDLIDEINAYEGNDRFTVGVYFHAVFENIHPFADGNGRLGRTLMNYLFMIHGIAPIIIYDEDKRTYYNVLEQFDLNEDLEPLRQFILSQQEKTWTKKESSNHKKLSAYTK